MTTTVGIYARRSNEQNGLTEEAKSVTRQKELARAFAVAKGWTVDDRFIFEDDGISGAEFERRPGLQQLLAILKPKPPFSVLIVAEQKALGREAYETGYLIKRLAQADVQIVEYVHGRSLTPKNWIDKVTSAVLASVDEGHREQTRERTYEAHRQKHERGYVVGGRVFGYRNVDVCRGVDIHGRPLRDHVDREIDSREAAVVVRIFELYDSGLGLKSIAKVLTRDGAPAPKPGHVLGLKPLGGWAPSTVRSVLTRELYHGVSVWGKTKTTDEWGQLDVQDLPQSDWMRTKVEHLRVVPEDLWQRVQARRRDIEGRAVRFASGRISGRPPKHAVQNLLAGLATCGVCGGGLVVEHSNNRKGKYSYYICHRHRHHGDLLCTNAMRMPLADMNESVLQAVEEHVLTPEAIDQVVLFTERDDLLERRGGLERESKDNATRIKRLREAIEVGGDARSLMQRIQELEARQRAIATEFRGLHPIPRLDATVVESRLAEWRRLLRQSPTQARAVLQRILVGRITFTPIVSLGSVTQNVYQFTATTRFDKLFTGVASPMPSFIKRGGMAGREHITPDETFDADYGRLLERAVARIAGKGERAQQDSNLRPPGS